MRFFYPKNGSNSIRVGRSSQILGTKKAFFTNLWKKLSFVIKKKKSKFHFGGFWGWGGNGGFLKQTPQNALNWLKNALKTSVYEWKSVRFWGKFLRFWVSP